MGKGAKRCAHPTAFGLLHQDIERPIPGIAFLSAAHDPCKACLAQAPDWGLGPGEPVPVEILQEFRHQGIVRRPQGHEDSLSGRQ